MVHEHPSELGHRRSVRFLGWLAIVMVGFVVAEVASCIFLFHQRQQYGQLFYFDIDHYVQGLQPAQLQVHKRAAELRHIWAPDPTLGWRRTPLSTHFFQASGTTVHTDRWGARVIPNAAGPASIATYGDSFTEGLEVSDAETWQAYMAYATGTRVLNFGVSAYGPDQAVLALEANLERGIHTPIVILAMINENLNRMMNTFRLFYTYPIDDIVLGFKPIFVHIDSGFEPKSFAPDDITDIDAVRRALWAASRYDWFYQHRTERIRFPFSLGAAGFLVRHGLNPVWWPDYSVGLPRARMEYILARFYHDSHKYKFTPVFVLLPGSVAELRSRMGNDHPVFSAMAGQSKFPGLIYIDVVKELSSVHAKMLVADFTPESYIAITHPSAQGNQAIARVIRARLRDQLAALGVRK